MVSLAAQAALAANVQVIRVLRLVGARAAYIVGAFVRRFALRSLIGGGCGAALGIGALLVFQIKQARKALWWVSAFRVLSGSCP